MSASASPFVNRRSRAALWSLYGVLRIAMAALLVVFSATARLIAGALLTRVPNPLTMMALFEVLYWIIIPWCIVCAILSFWAAGVRPARIQARASLSSPLSFLCTTSRSDSSLASSRFSFYTRARRPQSNRKSLWPTASLKSHLDTDTGAELFLSFRCFLVTFARLPLLDIGHVAIRFGCPMFTAALA